MANRYFEQVIILLRIVLKHVLEEDMGFGKYLRSDAVDRGYIFFSQFFCLSSYIRDK